MSYIRNKESAVNYKFEATGDSDGFIVSIELDLGNGEILN